MGRLKTVRKPKQDTPRKTTIPRRFCLKQMRSKIYEALPEGAEVNFPPVQRVRPFPVRETEMATGAEGSEDASPPSLVIDTSYCSETQDSSVFASSSCPSPETFREEHDVERCTFRLYDELADLHLPIRNSTLLEESHAENILAYRPPNLSAIRDISTILAENTKQDISRGMRSPSGGYKLITSPASDKACKTPAVVMKRVTAIKKQVCFRSPLLSERSNATLKRKIQCDKVLHRQIFPSSPQKKIEPDTEPLPALENDDVEGGAFFDFATDSERDGYFQKMRERCTKLKKAALFPLAVRPTELKANNTEHKLSKSYLKNKMYVPKVDMTG